MLAYGLDSRVRFRVRSLITYHDGLIMLGFWVQDSKSQIG